MRKTVRDLLVQTTKAYCGEYKTKLTDFMLKVENFHNIAHLGSLQECTFPHHRLLVSLSHSKAYH